MLQNARVAAFTVSELLRENQIEFSKIKDLEKRSAVNNQNKCERFRK